MLANPLPFLPRPSLDEYCSDRFRSFLRRIEQETMPTKNKKNLTTDQVNAAVAMLLDESSIVNGERRLAPGALQKVQTEFKIHKRQVSRIWARARKNREAKGTYVLSPSKKGKSGRPLLYDREEIAEALEKIDVEKRGTVRDIADGLGLSRHTAHSIIGEGHIKAHSASIKPILTPEQELTRMMYSAERLVRCSDDTYRFFDAHDEIHLDEKWFFICPQTRKVYLSDKEVKEGRIPQQKAKSKRFMIKVMFLCAVARPRFNANGECIFDGKIGLWPLVEQVEAKINSCNRPAGTLETKSVSVTKELYREYVCEKVIPSAIAKWPRGHAPVTHVGLQHDNPNTHFKAHDPIFMEAAESNARIKFHIREQPANSPDTNVLDLGFFRSLQTRAWKMKRAKNIDGLIACVREAWENYPPEKLNRIWLTHMAVCNIILEHHGKNDFDVPHQGKDKVEKRGELLSHRVWASDRAIQIAREVVDF